jgi:eukaryotic-like serine/threonine-protein kinase
MGGFDRTVVIKRILKHLASDPGFVELFLNEARLAALLSHPNLVQIFDVDSIEGTYFISMEYVPGITLRTLIDKLRMRRASVPIDIALSLATQALGGLQAAHDRQILHRDVSPDNLLLSSAGILKLADFGVAKAMQTKGKTRTGTLKGKCAYMAPEQLQSQVLDARADLYSLGVVFYELLTLARPFEGDTDPAIITSILTKEAPPPKRLRPDLPDAVSSVAIQAIAKRPEERFASATALCTALENAGDASVGVASQTRVSNWLVAENLLDQEAPLTGAPGTVALAAGTMQLGSLAPSKPRRRTGRWLGAAILAGAALTYFAVPKTSPSPSHSPVVSAPPSPPVATDVPPNPSLLVEAPAPSVAVTEPPRRSLARARTKMAPGNVVLHIKPWAEVVWNGRSQGLTPMGPLTLPAGKQTLVLVNKDLGVARTVVVSVPAGSQVTVTENLFPEAR